MAQVFYFNNVQLPTPDQGGVTYDFENLYSAEETSRNAEGTLTMKYIAMKRKITLKWSLLTPQEVDSIVKATTGKNAQGQFGLGEGLNLDAGTNVPLSKFNAYAKLSPYNLFDYCGRNKMARYDTVTCAFIEM